MGGWVRCLQCKDRFHASQNTLDEDYYHAVNVDPYEGDRDFFIHEKLV